MKVLRFHESKDEDCLQLSFECSLGHQAPLEQELEPFIRALEEHAGDWMPEVVRGTRQRKYSRPSFWKALEERRDEDTTGLGLYRTAWPPLEMALRVWFPPLPPEFWIFINITPLSFFEKQDR